MDNKQILLTLNDTVIRCRDANMTKADEYQVYVLIDDQSESPCTVLVYANTHAITSDLATLNTLLLLGTVKEEGVLELPIHHTVANYEKEKIPMVLCPWCRNEEYKVGEPICVTCCGDGYIPAKDL